MKAGTPYTRSDECFLSAQRGDPAAIELLVTENLPLVKFVVKRFIGRGKEYDDLFQTGCIGLMKAIQRFDPTMNVQFSTYAVPLIMGEIRRLLRDDNTIHVSRSLHDLSVKISSFCQSYEKQEGQSPPINCICEALDISQENAFMAINALQPIKSLSESLSTDSDLSLGDIIPDSSKDDSDERIYLSSIVSTLDEQERLLIHARYFERKTQREIGECIGMTQVQVSRLESRIINKLRKAAQN